MKKFLVFGIIALFVGLAFIPSFNAISISKNNKEIKQVVDEVEDDCFECQSNNNPLAEKLLNRFEKNEVLSNVIISVNPDDDRPICILLGKIVNNLEELYSSLLSIADNLPEGSILKDIYEMTAYLIFYRVIGRVLIIAIKFNCVV
jgi:hypothetical protein